MRPVHRRKGFALAVALAAIVVIGALVAGAFFASTQEFRIGRNSLVQERALTAAEFGATDFLNNWDPAWNTGLRDGQTVTRTVSMGGATGEVRMTRLNLNTFWVGSAALTGSAAAQAESRRRTGLLMRLRVPNIRIAGAVTTRDRTGVSGNAKVNGNDNVPAGWDCDSAGPPKAAIVNDNQGDVSTTGGCNGQACLTGTPKVLQDAAAADTNTYLNYGGLDFDSLAAEADHILAGGGTLDQMKPNPASSSGVCNTADIKNWGEPNRNLPAHVCEPFSPTIYITGSGVTTTIAQGRGQGILLIEGNAIFNGNFIWYGPVIVKGNVATEGMGNKIFGAVMAMNQGCTTNPCNNMKGTSDVLFSRCALMATLAAKAKPEIATRAWADLY